MKLKLKITLILIIPFLISCTRSGWKVDKPNKFLIENPIDTSAYKTIQELYAAQKVEKILVSDQINYNSNFVTPLVSNNKNVFFEKRYFPDYNKNVIVKLNQDGKIVDSIVINTDSRFINDFIVEKEYYISWFIDGNKSKKEFKNVNYFAKSDIKTIKKLVKSLQKNNDLYHASLEFTLRGNMDTCNYIITFKNNKLIKYNYLKSISPEYDLKITKDNSSRFSKNFKALPLINSSSLYRVDNYFLRTHHTKLSGVDSKTLYPTNTGTYPQFCNTLHGTSFITVLIEPELKLKNMKHSICDTKSFEEFSESYVTYSEESLNFYLITWNVYPDNDMYIINK